MRRKYENDTAKGRGEVYFVYIAQCADSTLYTGWTTDAAARIKAHNSGGGAKYTSARRPVRLVYLEELQNKSAAMKREAEIKKLSRPQKIRLIEGQRDKKEKTIANAEKI